MVKWGEEKWEERESWDGAELSGEKIPPLPTSLSSSSRETRFVVGLGPVHLLVTHAAYGGLDTGSILIFITIVGQYSSF